MPFPHHFVSWFTSTRTPPPPPNRHPITIFAFNFTFNSCFTSAHHPPPPTRPRPYLFYLQFLVHIRQTPTPIQPPLRPYFLIFDNFTSWFTSPPPPPHPTPPPFFIFLPSILGSHPPSPFPYFFKLYNNLVHIHPAPLAHNLAGFFSLLLFHFFY